MLNLSNELFKAFSKYLRADWSIDQFRDFMVGLRVDKYKLLADVDKLFLNEFEGRYAEFSDFAQDEVLLKASLARYVLADEASSAPAHVGFWFLPSELSSGSFSIGSPAPSGNFCPVSVETQVEYSPA
jgi:hypothetical protein